MLPLIDALICFGVAPIGPAWAVAALDLDALDSALDGRLPPAVPAGEAPLDAEGVLRLYMVPVARCFTSAVLAGRIVTAYTPAGSSVAKSMELDWWRTEDPLLRFRSLRVDPAAPYSDDGPCWVHVNGAEYQALIDELTQWRKSLPEYEGQDIPEPMGLTCRDDKGSAIRLMGDPDDALVIAPPILPDFGTRAAAAPPPPAANDRHVGDLAVTKKAAHRPALWRDFLTMFHERLTTGTVRRDRKDEITALLEGWPKSDPPKRETVSGWIAEYHGELVWNGAKASNAAEIADLIRLRLDR